MAALESKFALGGPLVRLGVVLLAVIGVELRFWAVVEKFSQLFSSIFQTKTLLTYFQKAYLKAFGL